MAKAQAAVVVVVWSTTGRQEVLWVASELVERKQDQKDLRGDPAVDCNVSKQ